MTVRIYRKLKKKGEALSKQICKKIHKSKERLKEKHGSN